MWKQAMEIVHWLLPESQTQKLPEIIQFKSYIPIPLPFFLVRIHLPPNISTQLINFCFGVSINMINYVKSNLQKLILHNRVRLNISYLFIYTYMYQDRIFLLNIKHSQKPSKRQKTCAKKIPGRWSGGSRRICGAFFRWSTRHIFQ